ncbi:hypothetical protein FBQ97_20705 [Acidobacteria bacterium ACD]|nr:MAG: hypothetical protein EDX89_09635 [Acidobacteriota bacterium]MCE7957480.1 hypothetical protein [Acidobacteria bacterium ACB2]MDL1952207.1 hypothetical protein [Acidobacteria bacterium ACD]
MRRTTRVAALVAFWWVVAALAAPPAGAQWIALGRKAIGKVKELTQSEKTGEPGYSMATVLVKAPADKVFAAALRTVQSNPKLRLTKSDPGSSSLEFADGKKVAGLAVSKVDEEVSQILVASTTSPGETNETSLVVSATLRICKEMGAECSLAKRD